MGPKAHCLPLPTRAAGQAVRLLEYAVDDQNNRDDAERQRGPSDDPAEPARLVGRRRRFLPGEAAFARQAIEFDAPLALHLVLGDAPRENDDVHREFRRSDVAVEEMEREDEADGEQRLLAVNERG